MRNHHDENTSSRQERFTSAKQGSMNSMKMNTREGCRDAHVVTSEHSDDGGDEL